MSGRKPRPLFPQAVSVQTAALIFEGDGRPALYLCAATHTGAPRLYRLPEDVRVTVTLPRALPTADKKKRVFLPRGSHATFQTPDGARSCLELHAVRPARELIEALEAHSAARQAWEAARQVFEGKPGQGAA